jgi:hypothetical protein
MMFNEWVVALVPLFNKFYNEVDNFSFRELGHASQILIVPSQLIRDEETQLV